MKMLDNALLLSAKDTPFVPDKFLKKEKDIRMCVVDSLSGFYLLSRTAAKKEESNELNLMRVLVDYHEAVLAIIQEFINFLD